MLGDRLCLRDPKGVTRRPSLVPLPGTGDLEIRGSFTILQQFAVAPDEGRAFVETSRDSNPIHTEDSVVPGAMTAARFLLLPEILISGLAVKRLKVKFRAFSHYDRETVNVYSIRPRRDGSVGVQLKSYQHGVLIAEATLDTRIPAPATSAPPSSEGSLAVEPEIACSPSADLVRAFLQSLRVQPDTYLGLLGFSYPRAFLAALPSGEMVRRGGASGLLNLLSLEFSDTAVPTLAEDPPPTAEVQPTRPRSNFWKVLARVGSGIKTHCQGYATVLAALVKGGAGLEQAPAD
jgi:hypothetical protein